MTTFLIGVSLLYGVILLVCTIALILYRSPRSSAQPFVSVVISARNEAERIGTCLEALARQSYPRDRYEVIVVDDRSDDDTASVVRRFERRLPALTVLRIDTPDPDMAPKKFAIQTGIQAARGRIILCTDADCRPEPKWIESMTACFTESVGMVIGYSPIDPNRGLSVLQSFVALDSLALASLACASALWKKPVTATGRSFAYRREVFDEVGGFRSIGRFISGDDDLLLQLVRKTHWSVAYCTESLVPTDPPSGYRQFMHQKIRQASKGRHYTPGTIATLVWIYFFNLSLVLWAPWGWWHGEPLAAMPLLIKLIADFGLLMTGGIRFRRLRFLLAYPLIGLLHPLYIVVFGAWGQFGKFEWKDQEHARHVEVQKQ
jgi:cellulose synthase/poly-beta-1,6-N-acetylglucosamine synthase-like glycosyltransferase